MLLTCRSRVSGVEGWGLLWFCRLLQAARVEALTQMRVLSVLCSSKMSDLGRRRAMACRRRVRRGRGREWIVAMSCEGKMSELLGLLNGNHRGHTGRLVLI